MNNLHYKNTSIPIFTVHEEAWYTDIFQFRVTYVRGKKLLIYNTFNPTGVFIFQQTLQTN